MGKGDGEQLPDSLQEPPDSGLGFAASVACGRLFRPRCVLTLVFGTAVLVSALFWLPPFMRAQGSLDESVTANIVASFRLQRAVSQLCENLTKLESDIFDEIGYPDTVVICYKLLKIATIDELQYQYRRKKEN